LCLLCQQPVGEEATGRLRRFEEFVRDTTQSAADAAQEAFDDAVRALGALNVGDTATADLAEDLRPEDLHVAAALDAFVDAAVAARVALVRVATDDSATPIADFPESPAPALGAAVGSLRARDRALREAVATGGTDQLKKELAELEAHKALAASEGLVKAERDRLRRAGAISTAKGATTTNAISQKAADLTAEVLTDILVDRFARETDRLGLENVVLRTVGGRRGVLRYKAGFLGASQEAPLPEVLSEGEQSALGLAGFLTEIWTDHSKSAAVFDDPVNSLDHGRRDKVAERLVLLAQERQTIVFTHDVSFVLALKKHAVHHGVVVTERSVERANNRPGRCQEFHKFSAKLVKERVEELKGEIERVRQLRGNLSEEDYRNRVDSWYKRLRQTWERTIEESLVGEILTRHDLQVHPKMVRTLVLFSAEDNRELQHGYGRATEGGESHDESSVINSPAPELGELERDLELLEAWHKRISQRRNLSEDQIYQRAVALESAGLAATPASRHR